MESILTTARSFNHLHKILFNKRIPKAFIFNAAPRIPSRSFPGEKGHNPDELAHVWVR